MCADTRQVSKPKVLQLSNIKKQFVLTVSKPKVLQLSNIKKQFVLT